MSNIFVTKYTSMLEHLIAVVRDPGNYTMKKKIKSIYEKSREKIQCPATFNFEHLITILNCYNENNTRSCRKHHQKNAVYRRSIKRKTN